jgi:hypothetical protein
MFQTSDYDFVDNITKSLEGKLNGLDISHGGNVFINNLQTLIPEETIDTLSAKIKRSREIPDIEKTLELITTCIDTRKRIEYFWNRQEHTGKTERDHKYAKAIKSSISDVKQYEELEDRCRKKLAAKKGVASLDPLVIDKRKVLTEDIKNIITFDQGIYGEILFRRYLLTQPDLLKKSEGSTSVAQFIEKKDLSLEDIEKLWYNQIHTLMADVLYSLSESVEVQMSNDKYPETKTPYTDENSVTVLDTKVMKEPWDKCAIEHWTAFYLVTDYDRSFSDLARIAPNFISLTYLRRMFLDSFDRSNLPKGTQFPKIPYACKPTISTAAQMFYMVEMALWAASVGSAIDVHHTKGNNNNYKARPFLFGDVFLGEKKLEALRYWLEKDNQYIYKIKNNDPAKPDEVYTNITEKNGNIIISSEGDPSNPTIHNWIGDVELKAAKARKFTEKPFPDTYEIFIASRKLNDPPEELFTYLQSRLNRSKAFAATAGSEKPLSHDDIEKIERQQIANNKRDSPEAQWRRELNEATEKQCDFVTWF